jgi:hypothetical protein
MKLKLSQWGVSTGLRKTKVGEAAAPPCMLGSREGSCCRSSLQNFIKISPPSPPRHLCSVLRKDFFWMNKKTLASQKSVNTKINWRDFSTEIRKNGWQGSWYYFLKVLPSSNFFYGMVNIFQTMVSRTVQICKKYPSLRNVLFCTRLSSPATEWVSHCCNTKQVNGLSSPTVTLSSVCRTHNGTRDRGRRTTGQRTVDRL